MISGAAVLAATLFWMGPGLTLAGVERPDKRVTETTGMPMSVLCSVYVYMSQDPDAMSQEVREFMDSLATPDQWETYYSRSEGFNSINLKYLFNYLGLVILFLLFIAVAQLGHGNLARVFLVIPVMAYNFGTMLLLSGNDFRFFHFNFLLVVPLLYIILQGKQQRPAPDPSSQNLRRSRRLE